MKNISTLPKLRTTCLEQILQQGDQHTWTVIKLISDICLYLHDWFAMTQKSCFCLCTWAHHPVGNNIYIVKARAVLISLAIAVTAIKWLRW